MTRDTLHGHLSSLGVFHLACCSVEFDGVSWVLSHGSFGSEFPVYV